jgi:hypothetical protein
MRGLRSTLWLSMALLLVGCSLLVPGLLLQRAVTSASPYSGQSPPIPPVPSSSASFIDSSQAASPNAPAVLDDTPQRLDLRGNEITRPVARYRVDDGGSLYEEHSPQTEVPRLKQPVM